MINYQKIADSVVFYENLKYTRIEAPWWVSQDIINLTKPPESSPDFVIAENKKVLVASGEQSFMYMASKGRLPIGQYLTVTPCFRNESIGTLSKKCFLKTELINNDPSQVSQHGVSEMVAQAWDFFVSQVPDKSLLAVETTEEGLDITYGGIEVGSYGLRVFPFMEWVYGTGCAEPRLSRAVKIAEFKNNYKRKFK